MAGNFNWIETSMLQNIDVAQRGLSKSPAFTLARRRRWLWASAPNTAIFQPGERPNDLQPLPFPDPPRIGRTMNRMPVRGAGVVALRAQATTMDVASYAEGHDLRHGPSCFQNHSS